MVARKGELIDHAIKSPRYIQVYSTVRDWIYHGSYKPGSRLPTEEELCGLFKVSRITTRKAVDMLADERLGKTSRVAQAEVIEVEADPETAHDLRLPAGARVQRASHVRLTDRSPVGFVITWVPAALKLRFDLRELNESPMLNLLERKGVDIASADQVISATLADARLASLLNTTVGAPLVHIRLVVFDSQRRPVERLVAWYRGDYYHHHVHLTRKAR